VSALVCCATLFVALSSGAGRDPGEPLRVQAEVGRGPYYVGQGIELRVAVVGRRDRPKIDLPQVPNAGAWIIGTDKRPISRSQIGTIVAEENQFLTRIRLVPHRSGTLQIPAIPVTVDDRTGRSPSLHVEVLPAPVEGRPAGFLGGVGRFAPQASASTAAVRVGQEFEFHITVAGPAAWGMTDPPELLRYDRLPLAIRIRPGPTHATNEPPERTFTYHLRPTRAGEAVLPPISISSFDPSLSRFQTHVTNGVPIRVIAVSPFDPASVQVGTTSARSAWWLERQWIAGSISGLALAAVSAWLLLMRRRLRARRLARESTARRFAASLAKSMASDSFLTDEAAAVPAGAAVSPASNGHLLSCPDHRAARRVSELLVRYLELGASRPPGALTPGEAAAGVTLVTRSSDLGTRAGRLMALSDRVLYAEAPVDSGIPELREQALALFDGLGRVRIS
jgi:BatD DUF11 like domain